MFKKKTNKKPARRRPAQRSSSRKTPAAPSVFSYHAKRSSTSSDNTGRGQAEEPEQRPVELRKPRASWFKRIIRVVVILVIAALFVSNLMLASQPKVVTVGASETHFLQDPKVYQDAAQRIFTSSFLNSNKVTIDIQEIRNQLRAEFPELADAVITLPLIGRQPTLFIQPSTSRVLLKTSRGELFVLDGNGRAIVTGNQAVSLRKAGLPEIADESGLDVRLGSQVMPGESITFITEVVRQLKAKNITVSSINLPAGNTEMHLRMEGAPYYVKFNLQGNAREETGVFWAAKEFVDSQKKTVNEYIDARVVGRVFFK